MALDFRLRDFAHPLSIVKLRRVLERTQYATASELRAYQARRLERVLDVALAEVPYYRDLVRRLGLRRQDFGGPEDISKLPVLDKQTVLKMPEHFVPARGPSGWSSTTTSGTSGKQLCLRMSREANVQEFVYYWRHWSWAGYRLGDSFAELSTVAFLSSPGVLHRPARLTGRLLLNSIRLSPASVREQWALIQDARCRFIKGLATVLYHFARLVRECAVRPRRFDAAFSTGETLLPFQRRLVEDVFDCKVYDSYGQMERLVAISECPRGRMHVNSDYGLIEIEPSVEVAAPRADGALGAPTSGVVGTTLYNLAMPLLRYRVGDFVELEAGEPPCPCGRTLPTVRCVAGRTSEVIKTKDGRIVTALFLLFEDLPGVRCGHVAQEPSGALRVRIVPEPNCDASAREAVSARVRAWFGRATEFRVESCSETELLPTVGVKRAAATSASA